MSEKLQCFYILSSGEMRTYGSTYDPQDDEPRDNPKVMPREISLNLHALTVDDQGFPVLEHRRQRSRLLAWSRPNTWNSLVISTNTGRTVRTHVNKEKPL